MSGNIFVSELTADIITNLYLYGTTTRPPNTESGMYDESLIRPEGAVTNVSVDINNYMDGGPGRFANPAFFEIIKQFFTGLVSIPDGEYDKNQMRDLLGLPIQFIDQKQWAYTDGKDDYAERVYIWNSVAFRLDDRTKFIIENGIRRIENFGIVPYSNINNTENFDLDSDDLAAILGNPLLGPRIDPSDIGRKVVISFEGERSVGTYTFEDYRASAQAAVMPSLFPLASLPTEMISLTRGLFENPGYSIRFLDGNNRPLLYGTIGQDSVDLSYVHGMTFAFTHPYLEPFTPFTGVTYVAGQGNDQITGTEYSDMLFGGSGNDTLDGAGGEDTLHGGLNDDTYILDEDGVTVVEKADEGTDTVKSNVTYTLNDNVENLELTGSDEISGTGNALDNIIKGNDESNNALSGLGGKDQIHGGDGDDNLMGGQGNDRLFGDDDDDMLLGEADADYLVGGEGEDILLGGAGFDTYSADDEDTIIDNDASGQVFLHGGRLTGGTRTQSAPENTYYGSGNTYVLNGTMLTVNGGLRINNYNNGDLGIHLKTEPEDPPPPPPEKPDMGDAERRTSPIVIDLDGDGVETQTLSRDRYFDHDANGMRESTAWAGADDGFLVRDIDGNGRIDNGREMFGTNTLLQSGQLAKNGYEALKELDSNQDGLVNASDAAFSQLRIWRDANGNGRTDAGELLTLEQAGIASLSTQWTASSTVDANGQLHAQVSTATRTNGTTAVTSDVWFQVDAGDRINALPLSENFLDLIDLPNAQAFGNLPDLRQSMANDPILKGLVEAFVAEQNPIQRDAMLEGLIFQWAGVANVDPNSRDPRMVYGHVMDARQLIVLEQLVGRGYEGTWCWGEKDPNPHGNAAPLLIAEFKEFQNYVRAQLLAQVDPASYSFIKDGFASGYSSVIVDWQEFHQAASALRTAGNLDKLGEIIGVMRSLGTYSPAFRTETAQAFADLQATYPDLAPLFNSPSVMGTIGNDSLFGGSEGEVIVADKGDDTVFGGGGNDSYYYRVGDGKDRIYDSSGTDQLVFMEGINVADIAVKRDLTSITLVVAAVGGAGEIRIDNVFDENGHLREGVIETIKFHDGTIWTLQDTLSRIVLPVTPGDDVLYGSIVADTIVAQGGNDQLLGLDGDDHLDGEGGNDTLTGGNGNDTLIGGTGDDLLNAGAGNDTYVFAAGFGHDVIENFDSQAQRVDKIEFSSGITASDIRVTRAGDDLVLTHTNGDTIRVRWHFSGDGIGPNSIDEIRFADGTVWNADALKASALNGTAGNDTLIGYASDDVIGGLSGNDEIHGQSGNDQLDGGEGNDRLYGEEGNDTLIGAAGNDVLEGGNGDDALDGGLGNDQLSGDYGVDVLFGREGDDTLQGGAGDDQLVGGTGNDRLEGGFGDDRYYFARGDGKDAILDLDGHSTIYVSNLPLSEIYFRRDGTSLVVRFTSSADDEIRLEQFFAPETGLALRGIRIDPGDGTARDISPSELDTEVLKATTGSDAIFGNALDNTIDALAGNDLVHGDGGNDQLSGGEGDDTLHGDVGNDTLAGDAGNDHLFGGAGEDVLQGGIGNDTLDGGEAFDSLSGGSGDDLYRVDAVGDAVIEAAGEGDDTIESAVSFTLPANVETLRLIGDANIDATGGIGNDRLIGNVGSNVLTGGAGNDVLNGAAGMDVLVGGVGDDTYVVDRSDDVVSELAGEGYDTVEAASDYTLSNHVEKLVLTGWANTGVGNALDNVLVGNASGNCLDGGAGDDQMIGGDGDDTYVVDSAGDVIVEVAGEGNDTVEVGFSYALNDVLENIRLTGTANVNATGNSESNVLEGNSGNNVLDGQAGADNMAGGAGDDYYVKDEAGDSIQESEDAGIDTIERHYETNYILTNNVENLILGSGVATGHGNELDNHIVGNSSGNSSLGLEGNDWIQGMGGNDQLFGDEGDDTLEGGTGNDYLEGGDGSDHLEGGDGNDQLGGGTGADTLIGGLGDDKYVLTLDGETDIIDNSHGGFDGIFFEETVSKEQLSFKRDGNDLLIIVDDNDEAPAARVVNHFLGGNYAIDYVQPSAPGSYYLTTAQINAKVAAYGTGYDTVIDGTESADTGGTALVGSSDRDWIRGLGGDDQMFGNSGNDKLQGGAGNDYLAGGLGNDTNTGNDILEGGDGNDTLAGQDGDDTLIGGLGNDTYMWDAGFDTIDNTGGGTDTLFFPNSIPVTRLTFRQDGNDLLILVDNNPAQGVRVINHFLGGDYALDYVYQNGGTGYNTAQMNQKAAMAGYDNLVQGTASSETLNGTSGKDLMFGGNGNDTLNGAANDDRLLGEAGNDALYGGAGADRLEGGLGDDTYTIDDNLDVIVELAGEGNDLVNASVTYVLGDNVERLTLTGSAAINGAGNALDNVLTGNGAVNTLNGGAGNDTLNGGTGADTLVGGAGNDTYVVDNTGDVITELADEGTDLVQSGVTYTLSSNVENLTLTGTSAINGTGNALDNVLVGNSGANTLRGYEGNDTLDGGTGNDTMIGGIGNDTYVVNATGDVVTELANEGADLVRSAVTYTLGNNVENLVLTGTSAINGTGNALDNVLTGNTGNNSLSGGVGNDTLDGAAGTDTLTGGAGADAYLHGRGYGADTVVENDATAGTVDVAKFLSGVGYDQLWFVRPSGTNNLEISIIGTSDKLTIKDWYKGSQYQVEEIRTTDGGYLLTAAKVQALVTKMATMTKPTTTTLTTAQRSQLDPVFATSWVQQAPPAGLMAMGNEFGSLDSVLMSGARQGAGSLEAIMPGGCYPQTPNDRTKWWRDHLPDPIPGSRLERWLETHSMPSIEDWLEGIEASSSSLSPEKAVLEVGDALTSTTIATAPNAASFADASETIRHVDRPQLGRGWDAEDTASGEPAAVFEGILPAPNWIDHFVKFGVHEIALDGIYDQMIARSQFSSQQTPIKVDALAHAATSDCQHLISVMALQTDRLTALEERHFVRQQHAEFTTMF